MVGRSTVISHYGHDTANTTILIRFFFESNNSVFSNFLKGLFLQKRSEEGRYIGENVIPELRGFLQL